MSHDPDEPDPLCRNVTAVSFVRRFTPLFTPFASHLRTPVANILGLAARETGYGTNEFFKYNALFNMETSVAKVGETPTFHYPFSDGWHPAAHAPRVFVATYPNPFASLQSFSTRYGAAVIGVQDANDFLTALKNAGFNKLPGFTDPAVLKVVAKRISCS